jgi:hypothetical protein
MALRPSLGFDDDKSGAACDEREFLKHVKLTIEVEARTCATGTLVTPEGTRTLQHRANAPPPTLISTPTRCQ